MISENLEGVFSELISTCAFKNDFFTKRVGNGVASGPAVACQPTYLFRPPGPCPGREEKNSSGDTAVVRLLHQVGRMCAGHLNTELKIKSSIEIEITNRSYPTSLILDF